MKPILRTIVGVTALCAGTLQLAAQSTQTNMTHGLTPQQSTTLRQTENLDDMRLLTQKLEAARKQAVTIALDQKATPKAVRAKVEAVAKIQVEIALLRYQNGVKPILPSVTEIQKSQVLESPGISYNQLFVGKTSGLDFVRRGHFTPN